MFTFENEKYEIKMQQFFGIIDKINGGKDFKYNY